MSTTPDEPTTGGSAGSASRWPVLDGWRMAVGTLTAVPVRPPSHVDSRVAGIAMLLAPVAALLPAAVWAAMGLLAVLGDSPSVALVLAVVAVCGQVLATRALHLDGLADLADGLSASYDRRTALAIMKTGDVGPSGATAIVLTLVLQIAATAALFTQAAAQPAVLCLGVTAVIASRFVLAVACVRGVPAATPAGLGATVAGSVSRVALVVAGVVLVLVCASGHFFFGISRLSVIVIVAAGVLTAVAVVARAVSRLGGITGDVLGATVEIACATTLLTAALYAALVLTPL
ncbi:adenosylcobinamide-GDP ribazoletransferase [Mobilicoccus caccae]|uniref:Adenosylcobinamide-GDP ribazoletransferase n=1 Tax=Mobilicoccus caccae TaxID=1859295 RepID=A0ABQ6IQ09_9MICO|nr:adenosylcobinamide-GDP ribazoletransferase [Mobilicoccus caccae]GMA39420.1 adenosylcobinamide-GDP ribazoletransferase [Mobilicoccus caccae]